MQIVEALADADVLDAGGQEAYTLQAGCRYVVYDSEAAHGNQGQSPISPAWNVKK